MGDSFIWIMMLVMTTAVVVFDTGIVHMVWWRKCKREQGKHRYSGTSNNQEEFNMKVFQIRKHFWNYTILGLGMKTPPKRGDVLYLLQKDYLTTVLVKKVITEAIPGKEYYRLELRTFGHIPKSIRGHCDSTLTDVYMSNLRAKDQVEPQKQYDTSSIQYPLVIRHSLKTFSSDVFAILMGLGAFALAATALIPESSRSLAAGILFVSLGLLFIAAGSSSLWRAYAFIIHVDSDGCVYIKHNRKTTKETLDTLRWGFKQTENKPEHRTMVLLASDGTSLGELADTEKGFAPLLALLRERMREIKSQELFKCIREKKWIQPLIAGEPMTEKTQADSDGNENICALVIVDSPVHLSHNDGEYRFKDISLENAVEMTEGFTVYQEIWLLLELPSGGRTQRARFVLKADNLEEVLGEVKS